MIVKLLTEHQKETAEARQIVGNLMLQFIFFAGYPKGWCFISDVLLQMPVCLFCELVNICYDVSSSLGRLGAGLVEGLQIMSHFNFNDTIAIRETPIMI